MIWQAERLNRLADAGDAQDRGHESIRSRPRGARYRTCWCDLLRLDLPTDTQLPAVAEQVSARVLTQEVDLVAVVIIADGVAARTYRTPALPTPDLRTGSGQTVR